MQEGRIDRALRRVYDAAGALKLTPYGFRGRYGGWEEAAHHASGYDEAAILEAVARASREVAQGRAAFERDGVAFPEDDPAWPELACLLRIANEEGSLRVLDFGGSLGGFYRQHRGWFGRREAVWSVVEQPHYVAEGRASWEGDGLRFFGSIDEAVRESRPHTFLFSGVLQYLRDPAAVAREAIARKPRWILVARTTVARDVGQSWIAVQWVRMVGLESSYPVHVFDESKLRELFHGYELVAELPPRHRSGSELRFAGFLLKASA